MFVESIFVKDYLGNIKMTVNSTGTQLSWDDYYPYGSIMPNRSSSNAGIVGRYKFTGKEKDAAETGYDYFGARYGVYPDENREQLYWQMAAGRPAG